jgi:hypothetical protein
MSAPLKVRVGVSPEAQPVLEALGRLAVDIGSVAASRFFPPGLLPSWARFLCVAVADERGVIDLAAALRRELRGNDAALALCNKCLVHHLPLDARLMVFLDIPAIDAPP